MKNSYVIGSILLLFINSAAAAQNSNILYNIYDKPYGPTITTQSPIQLQPNKPDDYILITPERKQKIVENFPRTATKLGIEHDSDFGNVVVGKWAQLLGYNLAFMLEGNLGNKEGRVGVTGAWLITPNQSIKFTYEYLRQQLAFDFTTGTMHESRGQHAEALAYKYIAPGSFFHGIEVSGYMSRAGSKYLGWKNIDSENVEERFIAGGVAKGAAANIMLKAGNTAQLSAGLNYDDVLYKTKFVAHPTSSGFGFNAHVEQILAPTLKLIVSASDRNPYNKYSAELHLLAPTAPGTQLDWTLFINYIKGKMTLPSDTRFGLQGDFRWGNDAFNKNSVYTLPDGERLDLINWVMQPAVHMDKVLAIKDSRIIGSPTSAAIDSEWVTVGEQFNVVTLNDGDADHFHPNGGDLVFSLPTAPTWAELESESSGGITGTPPSNAVDSPVTVKATTHIDGKNTNLSTSQSFTLYVKPTSNSSGDTTIAMNHDFNINDHDYGNFNGHGGDLTYTMEPNSSCLEFNAATGNVHIPYNLFCAGTLDVDFTGTKTTSIGTSSTTWHSRIHITIISPSKK